MTLAYGIIQYSSVIPAKAGTSVCFTSIVNGGPRFHGDDTVS